jgi:hypothetical protein
MIKKQRRASGKGNLMKILSIFLTLISLSATVWAAGPAQKELQQYPRWIQIECLKLTNYRDRKAVYNNYPAALQCAKNTVAELDRQKALDAELKLTEEKIKWLRANRYRSNPYPGVEK